MEPSSTFFVLWNGSSDGLDPETRQEMIGSTAAGIDWPDSWSFGQGHGNPLCGDRVFMLRTGTNRGVVASGELTDDGVFDDGHWDGSDSPAHYVSVSWDVMLSDEDRLPIERIKEELTEFKFPVLNSGRRIYEPSATALAELWEYHLNGLSVVTRNPWLGGRKSAIGGRRACRIPLEINRTKEYYVNSFTSVRAQRLESAMVHRFATSLERQGIDVSSYKMPVPDSSRALIGDLFDNTNQVLYEAKASCSREAVRMALGQLLDYRRHFAATPTVAVLLPERPSDDLLALLAEHRVGCVYEESGQFVSAFSDDSAT